MIKRKSLTLRALFNQLGIDIRLKSFRYDDDLKGVNIQQEYKLIQDKKSGLSRRLREEVVRRYERTQA